MTLQSVTEAAYGQYLYQTCSLPLSIFYS